MFRRSKTVTVAILTGAVLLRSTAHAQVTTTTAKTTTTTTTSTTTTTLAPHPFSKATKQCIKTAQQEFDCHRPPSQCSSAFQNAYAACFEGSAGMSCATKCLTAESKCFSSLPATQKKCRTTCRTNKKNDVKACQLLPIGDNIWASQDSGCLMTADVTFSNCKFQCTAPEQRMVCQTNFTFCIANCQNLP